MILIRTGDTMFSNFKQAFKKDESTTSNIPQAVLDALSEELPRD